ncbi:hypothetical protein BDZ97DRAFT_612767 [Flammula alnicola]|nr:hypothetical protein BDZ97DRAFT_612767 [Flammula alnicola]
MANVQLNGDVYAHLLSFVSSPSDLLAVSLANKELLTLAEPEIIYRSIRCKLGNDAVWEHLIANPAQASRVRELEVLRENLSGYGPLDEEEKIPESSGTFKPSSKSADEDALATTSREKTEHSERLLIQAIQSLVNLESFTWDHWVPEINQGEEVLRDAGEGDNDEPLETYSEDVWTALRDHTQLKRLKVVDLGRKDTRSPDPRPIFDSTIFTLGNLTHFDLKMYYSPADPLEGENGGNDEDSDDELLPPRVKIERIRSY